MNADFAFLCAIRERPDDADPRLIYADWLEERGDVRAELIRIRYELELATQPNLRFFALLEREEQLRRRIDPDWLAAMGYARSVQVHRNLLLMRIALRRPLGPAELQRLGPVSWIELAAAIERLLKDLGRYPLEAEMYDAQPPLYFGPQLRRRAEGGFLAANCSEFSIDGEASPLRIFADAHSAVRHFLRCEVRPDAGRLSIAGVILEGVTLT